MYGVGCHRLIRRQSPAFAATRAERINVARRTISLIYQNVTLQPGGFTRMPSPWCLCALHFALRRKMLDMAPYEVGNVVAGVALAQYAGVMSDQQLPLAQLLSAVATANSGPGFSYP
jgi:hypothetical protein